MDLEILGPATDDDLTSIDASYNETVGILTQELLEMTLYQVFVDAELLNNTFSACWDCNIDWTMMYGDFMIIFADIIQKTNRAANMFDAYITAVAFSLYQEIISNVGTNETVQLASIKTTQSPLRCAVNGCPGYISATVLLGVYLVLVGATTGLYIRHAHFSRCSSVWPAIAQLVSEELRDTLDSATEASDDSVQKIAQREDKNAWVTLERSADGKRVHVVSVRDDRSVERDRPKRRLREPATW